MAMQTQVPIQKSQKAWFELWDDVYRGRLGIALSDTLGTPSFLRDFDLSIAKRFDGARQDSGDPFVWGETFIAHLQSLGIDPRTKTAVFSDSLDDAKAAELWRRFGKRVRPQFGIGTYFSNDLGPRAAVERDQARARRRLPGVQAGRRPGEGAGGRRGVPAVRAAPGDGGDAEGVNRLGDNILDESPFETRRHDEARRPRRDAPASLWPSCFKKPPGLRARGPRPGLLNRPPIAKVIRQVCCRHRLQRECGAVEVEDAQPGNSGVERDDSPVAGA